MGMINKRKDSSNSPRVALRIVLNIEEDIKRSLRKTDPTIQVIFHSRGINLEIRRTIVT